MLPISTFHCIPLPLIESWPALESGLHSPTAEVAHLIDLSFNRGKTIVVIYLVGHKSAGNQIRILWKNSKCHSLPSHFFKPLLSTLLQRWSQLWTTMRNTAMTKKRHQKHPALGSSTPRWPIRGTWKPSEENRKEMWDQQNPIPIPHMHSRSQMQWTTVLDWLREHAGKISFLTEFLPLEEIDVVDRVHWKAKKKNISPKSHFLAALLGPSEEESQLWEISVPREVCCFNLHLTTLWCWVVCTPGPNLTTSFPNPRGPQSSFLPG